jgi:hypothetical protein
MRQGEIRRGASVWQGGERLVNGGAGGVRGGNGMWAAEHASREEWVCGRVCGQAGVRACGRVGVWA